MVMVICYDAWSCPRSYLLIRKQPLRQEGLLFISLMTLASSPHVLSPTSLRRQRNEVAYLLQLQNLRWHRRRQIVLKGAIPLFNRGAELVRKYWTLKISPIRPRIPDLNWQWSITTVSWLECAKSCRSCLVFSVCFFVLFRVSASAPGPVELRRSVEHWCSRTSFERQGEASVQWGDQRDELFRTSLAWQDASKIPTPVPQNTWTYDIPKIMIDW